MKERRRAKRYKVLLSVNYTNNQGFVSIESDSVSRNLSEGGVCLLVNKTVKPGATLDMELDIPGQLGTVSAKGKVVWVKQGADRTMGDKDAGIRFIKMSDADHKKILSYIHVLEQNGAINGPTSFKDNLIAGEAALNLLMFVLKKIMSNV